MMSDRLKHWLKDKLINLVSVQRCTLDPAASIVSRAYPADLRVLLWIGVTVHIYVLMDVPKMRTLKQVIQHDTNHGIGSMFVVAPHLVPAPKTRLAPPEWMMALHSLNNERIYTYSPEDRELALMQLHFERIDATEQYETIYGPEVRIDRMHYGRINIKPRMIKGFWLMAHFGAGSFWQQERRRFYMPPPRASHSTSEHGAAANGSSGSANSARAPKSRLEQSYEILGIHLGATQEEVKTAFRRQVFNVHPDVSALPKVIAEERFRLLAEAYEYIKGERDWM